MISDVILLILALVALFVIIAGTLVWFRDMHIAPVPSISTRAAILEEMLCLLALSKGDVVYDLGCGQGRVVQAIARAYPNVSVVGVERGVLPFLFASILTRELNARIVYGDLFRTSLEGATHVYVYLYPEVVQKLSPILRTTLQKGARVVSLDFPFPDWDYDQCVEVLGTRYTLGKKLYLYTV